MATKNHELVEYIKNNLAIRGRDLAAFLVAEGYTKDAARKRISRLSERQGIRKLLGFIPNNESVFYSSQSFGSDGFIAQVAEILRETGAAGWSAISGVKVRGGVVSKDEFPVASGLPFRRKGHVSYEVILNKLLRNELLKEITLADQKTGYALPDVLCPERLTVGGKKANDYLVDVFLSAFHSWMRNLNLISANLLKKNEQVNGVYWDFGGPSYWNCMRRFDKKLTNPNPSGNDSGNCGFVAGDFLLGKSEVDEDDLNYYFKKCETAAFARNSRPFLPVLVANRFSDPAYRLGRNKGYMFVTPRSLFGNSVAQAFEMLLDILTRLGGKIELNDTTEAEMIERLDKVYKCLDDIGGVELNFKGPLLELMIAYASSCGGTYMVPEIGVLVPKVSAGEDGQLAGTDIDVMCKSSGGNEVTLWECKAYAVTKQVTLQEVEKWTGVQIPAINAWLKEHERVSIKKKFIFATTGTFAEDALAHLKDKQSMTSRYQISFMDGVGVHSFIKGNVPQRSGILDIYREQFRKSNR